MAKKAVKKTPAKTRAPAKAKQVAVTLASTDEINEEITSLKKTRKPRQPRATGSKLDYIVDRKLAALYDKAPDALKMFVGKDGYVAMLKGVIAQSIALAEEDMRKAINEQLSGWDWNVGKPVAQFGPEGNFIGLAAEGVAKPRKSKSAPAASAPADAESSDEEDDDI